MMLELSMSELNGLAVLRQIREGSRTPIIMVAASGSKDRAKQAATVGAQDDCLADCGKTRLVGFDRLGTIGKHQYIQ